MKKKLIEAQEKVEQAYRQLTDDPNLLAPQFQGNNGRNSTLAELAIVIMNLSKAIDACVESEQLNGGLN